MISNTLINMFLDDFDSTDELETSVIFALKEEQLNNERRSKCRFHPFPKPKILNRERVQGHEILYYPYFINQRIYTLKVV